MSRLNATDAYFAFLDSPKAPMNMGSVLILKRGTKNKNTFFEEFQQFVADRIDYIPKLKQRLVMKRPGLPHWADCENFKLHEHIQHVQLASPNPIELGRELGRIQFEPLDMSKPPFMFYVIEGLANDQIAVVEKFHHAFADGKTVVKVTQLFSDEGIEKVRKDVKTRKESLPGFLRRSIGGLLEDARRGLVSLPGIVRVARQLTGEQGKKLKERMKAPPKTAFNQPLSTERAVAHASWPLDHLHRARRAAGLTFNEIGLAMLGGATRRYFEERGDLPDETLVCNVPVALPASGSSGNAVLMTPIPIGSHLASRKERIDFIREESSIAKSIITDIAGAALQGGATIQLPSYLVRALGIYGGSSWIVGHMPLTANISFSNVPGPEKVFHICGRVVEEQFGLSMVLHGIGVSATLTSYNNKAISSIVACANALPEPQILLDYMGDELLEIEKLYGSSGVTKRSPKKRSPRRKVARNSVPKSKAGSANKTS